MKHEKIAQPGKSVASWSDEPVDAPSDIHDLATEIMNIMEQGILVWSKDGICELHNTRIFDVLELSGGDLQIGAEREEFRDRALARGEMSEEDRRMSQAQIRAHQPYSFDRHLPSGRVVLTSGRPARGGGYVVTFTDVTEARRAAREIAKAKQDAEDAELRAREVLASERARQNEARMLGQLDEWLQSCKSLNELYMIVSRFMERLLPGSKGELYIYSNSRDALDGVCNWNTIDLHQSIAADSCWALRRGRAYEYESDGLCFVCDHVEAHNHGVDTNEYICVPIVAHGDTVGLMHMRFDHASDGAAHVRDSAQFAVRCGEHISMAIANVKLRDELHDQSIRDPLTGLYNRRYFMDAIRREISMSDRRGRTFGLISFDADKFKNFNDNHGHDAGDMVLRAIGTRLQEVMNNGETACRFGGEEFAVLVPEASLEKTVDLAETLRDAIAATQVRYLDGPLPRVTISAGVSSYPNCGNTPQALLKRADEALYRAKEDGRNCVRTASAKKAGRAKAEKT
ncbi:diguanylate cyclase [Loktanella sp. IMCC34160]|uniref:sensor domain-containing diguanylate cyclase n=1 Tax=Loktanella sp. IMCC34160 TaxID=2510646 RepID=UPI00101BABB9|nr:sensor domain-containing diguanylate cyclase [Loktanella sp. IMCC34160]RYG93194.1 diguanylate cyclase [Loktanella sp. IMCC34160]